MIIPSIAEAALNALRDHGYAVTIHSPDQLEGVDPQYMDRVLAQAGRDFIDTHGLSEYRTTYFEEDPSEPLFFDCSATDVNHVVEQFEEANPEGHILSIECRS